METATIVITTHRPLTRTEAAGQLGQSLLDVALDNNICIDHACGGVCACSTCHVWVTEGMQYLSGPTDDELDYLDRAPGLRPDSRLACQARILRGGVRISCEVPLWNRNAVRE